MGKAAKEDQEECSLCSRRVPMVTQQAYVVLEA